MKPLAAMALLVSIFGLLVSSQATAGVALVGFAGVLAILARMVQAERHHQK